MARAESIVLINTGHGKGKSSAAFGVMARGWARGWTTGVVQFVKGGKWKTGERKLADQPADRRARGAERRCEHDPRGAAVDEQAVGHAGNGAVVSVYPYAPAPVGDPGQHEAGGECDHDREAERHATSWTPRRRAIRR